MTKKKQNGRPLLFCEWMVGRTIDQAMAAAQKKRERELAKLAPKPDPAPKPEPEPKQQSPPQPQPKMPKQGGFKVEFTTDDEGEEDTFKLTYPRTRGTASSGRVKLKANDQGEELESEVDSDGSSLIIKKVRFNAKPAPRKSALKKPKPAASESEPSSESSKESSKSSDSASTSEGSEKTSKKKDKKHKKKKKHVETSSSEAETETSSTASASTTADDSDPHPTCECKDCVHGRAKLKKYKKDKKHKKADSESEASQSEAEIPSKAKQTKSKAKNKSKRKDSDTAETSTEMETSGTDEKPKEDAEKKQEKDKGKAKKEGGENGKSKKQKEDKSKKNEDKDAKNDAETKTSDSLQETQQKLPFPHARHPQLLEPIKAQLVHTEKVIEGPNDPMPNAYYDSQNNLLRVYHGSTYGNNHQPLYPRQDPGLQPPNMGQYHPNQNPYFHGFNQNPYPPPVNYFGNHPGYPGGYAPPFGHSNGQVADGMPGHGAFGGRGDRVTGYPPPRNPQATNSSRNGQYVPTAKAPAPSSKGKDVSDNVGPKVSQLGSPFVFRPKNTKPYPFKSVNANPYYERPNEISQFSQLGSNKAASHAGADKNGGRSGKGNTNGTRVNSYNSAWDNKSQGGNGWGNSNNNSNNGDQWGTANNNTTTNEWGTDNNGAGPSNSNNNNSWDTTANNEPSTSYPQKDKIEDINNVGPGPSGGSNNGSQTAMPGAWMPENNYTSDWKDNTMAAGGGGEW